MKVLVTCATSGIGQAVLATATDRTTKIQWLPASRSDSDHLPLDFNRSEHFAALAERCGTLDGLVLIPPRVPPPMDLIPEPEQWHEYFSLAFVQPLQCLKAILAAQSLPKPFKIVLLGGLSSVWALPAYGSANALRLAWLGQVKSLALALGEQGVRINTLSLGAVLTDSYIGKLERKAAQEQRSYQQQLHLETDNVPTGKYSSPGDVANAIVALLGPMSDQMTGQNLLMDGGFFRGY